MLEILRKSDVKRSRNLQNSPVACKLEREDKQRYKLVHLGRPT